MKHFKQYLMFLIIGIIQMINANAVPLYDKPVFLLNYKIYGTGAETRLNDIPVVNSKNQGKTQTTRPVSENIIDGINSVTIKAFTLEKDNNEFRDGSYIDVTLSINNENAPLGDGTPLLHLRINPTLDDLLFQTKSFENNSKPENILNNKNEIIVKREVSIKSPFPKWAWQDGKTIENNQDNFNSLLKQYKIIYQALNNKDSKSVFSLYNATAKEFASAYNMPNINGGHNVISTGELMNDSDWKLGDIELILTKRKYHLEIFANGKLARIVDNFQKQSLITYLNPSDRLTSFQKFAFYINENNEWVMIR